MGIVDYVKDSRLFGKRSIYLNKDGTSKTISVGAGGGFSLNGIDSFKRNKKLLRTYWKYYQGEGTIFASINTIAWNTVMVGYRLDSDNPDAKKLIETRFNEMDIDGILLDNVIYTLVFGDSFIEKCIGTRNNIESLDNPLEKYIAPSVARLKDIMKPNSKDYMYPNMRKCYKNRLEQLKLLFHDSNNISKTQNIKQRLLGYISYVKTVDPITMEIIVNKGTGEKTGYKQDIAGRKTPDLKLDEIIHIGFFPQADSPYHISLIGPSKNTIKRMIDVDEALYHTTVRHSGRKYVATVGTDDEPVPPKDVFDRIKNDLEDISANNEFVVPKVIEMDTIDEGGFPGIQDHSTLFQKKTIVGLMCPEESLGMSTRGSTDATAAVREIMFERFIQALQHKLATKLRVELINPLLIENGFDENIVHMKFRSVTTRDEEGFAKWFGNLLRGFQFSPQKPITINEIRDAFHLPPIEGGDDLTWGGQIRPSPQETAD